MDGAGKSLPSRCHLNFRERQKRSDLCKLEVLGGAACHTQYSHFVHCSNVTANYTNCKERVSREPLRKAAEKLSLPLCFRKLLMNDGHSCLVTFTKRAGSVSPTPAQPHWDTSVPSSPGHKPQGNLERVEWSLISPKHFDQTARSSQNLWKFWLWYALC